jgi:hypothetical protein
MKPTKIWSSGKGTRLATAVAVVLSFVVSSPAKEKEHGAELLIQTKDGRTVKAELLAVKGRDLIMRDSSAISEVIVGIDEARSIKVIKKSKFFQGLGWGLLVGGGGGAGIGFLSGDDKGGWFALTAEEKALAGGIFFGALGSALGGIYGIIKGMDEYVETEGKAPQEIEGILIKLDRKARFLQRQPQAILNPEPTPEKSKTGQNKENESSLTGNTKFAASPPQKSASARFSRFHLTYRPGFFRYQSASRCMTLFEEIGFGDTKPAYELSFFGFSFGPVSACDYPRTDKNSGWTFEDIRLDYSITRKFAVGVGYSSSGLQKVDGYRYIPITRAGESYYSELYLSENFSSKLYYLQFSWMPVPDGFLRKVSFLLGAGVGLSQSKISLMTSKSSYEDNPDRKNFSKSTIALVGTAEFNYFFNSHLSLGFGAEYQYVPVKVESCRLTGRYYDLDESMNLIESTIPIDIPGHTVNASGFRIGLNAGFHF